MAANLSQGPYACLRGSAIAAETPASERMQVVVMNAYGPLEAIEQRPRLHLLAGPLTSTPVASA